MKIMFVSNYFNNHQKALFDALYSMVEYTIIPCSRMGEDRAILGYSAEKEPKYIVQINDKIREAVEERLKESDVIILGSV